MFLLVLYTVAKLWSQLPEVDKYIKKLYKLPHVYDSENTLQSTVLIPWDY